MSILQTYLTLESLLAQRPDENEYLIPLGVIGDLAESMGVTVQLLNGSQRPSYFIFPQSEKEIGEKVDVQVFDAVGVFCNTPVEALVNCFETLRSHMKNKGFDTLFIYDGNYIVKKQRGEPQYYAHVSVFPYSQPKSRFNSPDDFKE